MEPGILLEKGDIRINLMPEGRTSLERIEGEAVINNATTLTADAKKEIENALVKIGFVATAENLQNDADIDNIAKEAKKGAAGYNSRIVYFQGNWQPYSRTGQPLYKSVSGCGEIPLNALPAGAVISLEIAGSGKLKDTPQAPGFEITMGAIVLILAIIWRKQDN